MNSRTIRRAALLAVVTAFSVAGPAQAHHIPTCQGLSNPQCNVNYFYAHQAQPIVDEIQPYLDTVFEIANCALDEWCVRDTFYDLVREVDDTVWPYVYPVVCEYLGACE